MEIDGRRVRIDVRDDEGRLRSIKALSRRLRPLPLAAVEKVVAAIAAQFGAEPAGCDAHALLTAAELRDLAADPLFDLGRPRDDAHDAECADAGRAGARLVSSRAALASSPVRADRSRVSLRDARRDRRGDGSAAAAAGYERGT